MPEEIYCKSDMEYRYWGGKIKQDPKLDCRWFEWLYAGIFGYTRFDYKGMRVLDIGPGPRDTLAWLKGIASEIVGLDPLNDKYENLRSEYNLPKRVMKLVTAPAEKIPFKDSYFDLVCMCNAFDHVDDQRETVREICRVLRPGGRLLLLVEACGHLPYPHEPNPVDWSCAEKFFPTMKTLQKVCHRWHPGLHTSVFEGIYDDPTDRDHGLLVVEMENV